MRLRGYMGPRSASAPDPRAGARACGCASGPLPSAATVTCVPDLSLRPRQPAWCKLHCVSWQPMDNRFNPHAHRGFTLLELLTVMTVAAILIAVAVPSYRYVTSANRIAAEVNGLLGDMQYARAEAIKEGQTVTVCVSSNNTSCSAATTWHSGWIVFSDV